LELPAGDPFIHEALRTEDVEGGGRITGTAMVPITDNPETQVRVLYPLHLAGWGVPGIPATHYAPAMKNGRLGAPILFHCRN